MMSDPRNPLPLQTSESVRGTDRSTQPASGSQAIESLVMTKITSYLRPVTGFGLSLAICALGGCASPGDAVGSDSRSRETAATIEMHPFQVDDGFMAPRSGRDPDTLPPAIDFAPGAVTFVGTAVAEIIDSRRRFGRRRCCQSTRGTRRFPEHHRTTFEPVA
jgi:hypothetical protein